MKFTDNSYIVVFYNIDKQVSNQIIQINLSLQKPEIQHLVINYTTTIIQLDIQ